MENMLGKLYLYMEYEKFANNPDLYFSMLTHEGINIITNEYLQYDVNKVLKQIEFFNLFVQNIDKLTDNNKSKIFEQGNKEKNFIICWLFSRVAIFSDLIRAGIFDSSSVIDKKTSEKKSILFGIQCNFDLCCKFLSGYLEKYKPNLTLRERDDLFNEVGMSIIKTNPNDFEPDTLEHFKREFDDPNGLYS